MRTKQVSYAYPTSANAEHFGHGPDGCWIVERGEGNFCYPGIPITSHKTEREAIDAAYVLDMPWGKNWFWLAHTFDGHALAS